MTEFNCIKFERIFFKKKRFQPNEMEFLSIKYFTYININIFVIFD